MLTKRSRHLLSTLLVSQERVLVLKPDDDEDDGDDDNLGKASAKE